MRFKVSLKIGVGDHTDGMHSLSYNDSVLEMNRKH